MTETQTEIYSIKDVSDFQSTNVVETFQKAKGIAKTTRVKVTILRDNNPAFLVDRKGTLVTV